MRFRILHFARVINRYDFIDTVIRQANPATFSLMACTLTRESHIAPPDYAAAGIRHWVLSGRARLEYPLTIVRLARLLRRERVDLLHTHHYDEALIGVLAARLAGTRATVIGRHYHDELYLVAGGAKLRALLAVEGMANRLARRIIVPSTAIRELLVGQQGVAAGKVRVVPYGFEFAAPRYQVPTEAEARAVRADLGLAGAFVVGNFGRHHALKGQDYLIRAFAELLRDVPAARLLMVGDGPFHGALRALVGHLGIARQVSFVGWRTDAVRLMAAVDVVAHPTLLDSFPQVMVEALVLAKPLVVTDAAGPADQIQHGRTGFMIPMRDVGAIHAGLRWVATHPGEARDMGTEGRRYVLEALDITRVIRRYEAVYTELLAEHPARRPPGG